LSHESAEDIPGIGKHSYLTLDEVSNNKQISSTTDFDSCFKVLREIFFKNNFYFSKLLKMLLNNVTSACDNILISSFLNKWEKKTHHRLMTSTNVCLPP